ncbi:ABC-type multidrug transport system ATPase subunit [Clostridium tetanomorphum]|uniref:ABC transporter ATP-binding protein n=1 Tax=Clostridium tetanomorphum TaxID=1553 RepID=A0A923EB98_CLOTT|nr:ABC transporter ATP-binding protein [Clostridium tetanomorphum]KAJ52904.1 ABC transporter ATP-binding protein [Clostridium tetanomorphum DSM 665]MBC2399885.1 ABC transporter ATP-binding protein [Clostridium tetanomorphum]MBP1865957.1 ABC-type multidrug transport system ATPase subunit [Clostridium tetanomorphum]NRS85989.1 ABC-type multidrug transport system ATPase subunit [Clostridium tetanomorphum]NRZ96001.1 ABC-type multidrug transport system ATPase subunit [Clostridium tetanomorphum]
MKLFVDNISKKFKDLNAVDDVNLEFIPGIWGLLGPNGAGKTTLMRMMVRNIKPSKGKIMLDGVNIVELRETYLDKVGYLPQQFGYDKNQSVEDFLHYIGALKGINKELRSERISELLSQFNLLEVRKKKVDKLSGGMKRRVGICQAMLNNPEILIVDEPTAGLDIEERRKFRQYLTTISKEKIVILSTHIVSDIEFIANYLVLMEKGKLIAAGESNSLIQTLEGNVFETVVSENEMARVEKEYKIMNFRNEGRGQVTIRYVADTPLANSKLVSPSLNDFYLSKVKEV